MAPPDDPTAPATPLLDGLMATVPVEAPSYQAQTVTGEGHLLGILQGVDARLADEDEEHGFLAELVEGLAERHDWDNAPVRIEFHPGRGQPAELITADWFSAYPATGA
jgi:hypothetical protein